MRVEEALDVGTQKLGEFNDNEFWKRYPDWDRNIRPYFYVSDVFSCPRKLFFEFDKNIKKPELDINTRRVFINGEDSHDRIRKYIKFSGMPIMEEISIVPYPLTMKKNDKGEEVPDLTIHGRCDGIITENGNKNIIEIKSTNQYKVTNPMEQHIAQLQLYMYFFEQKFNTKEGVLIYELKPNNQIATFRFKQDIFIIKKALDFFKNVADNIKKEKLPEMPEEYKHDKYPCGWASGKCGYYEHCWGCEKLN